MACRAPVSRETSLHPTGCSYFDATAHRLGAKRKENLILFQVLIKSCANKFHLGF